MVPRIPVVHCQHHAANNAVQGQRSSSNTSQTPPLHIRIPLIQASALVAESVTFPIDFVKTRMQVHSSGTAKFSGVLASTVRQHGVWEIYKGIQPAVIRHWVYTATRVVLYEDLRNALTKLHGDGTMDTSADTPLWIRMVAGFTAGGIGQLLASPADLVKVRLQTGSGQYKGFLDAIRSIHRSEGLAGFYRGWQPNVTRACLVNLGELATYDQAKRNVMLVTGLGDGVYTHTLSALCSGFFAALCSTPADVCKSRVMSGAYPTMLSCVVGTVKQEGVAALWKGFFPTWLRLGPWQFCFWLSYEHLRMQTTGSGF
eukprot:m.71009 g.71009  ORF g.71009 m.71009 type:complete len:314 (+) comp16068_c0_seq8:119-1060(+)